MNRREKKLDALEDILQALIQAQISSSHSRDLNQANLIDSFMRTLSEVQNIAPQPPEERSKPVDELALAIINLIAPKKD
jgi:hypothetical protein